MNYKYLIINENINGGLIKSQVIEPLKSLKMNNISIINIHKVNINNENDKSLNYINIPIAIPYKLFLFNCLFFLTPLFAFIYALILSAIIDKNTTVISRSYFPSLVSFFLSKIIKNDFIFDTRSLFIDENTINGNIKTDGFNYKMWKYFEKKILFNAKSIIAVALEQKKYYNAICNTADVKLIPCYTRVHPNYLDNESTEIRTKLGFKKQDIVICYFGSLDDGWNNIDMYRNFFKECIHYGYKILVISQDYNKLIKDNRLNSLNIHLLNTNNMKNEELIKYVQISDYGVVLMQQSADWKTRLSVKYVEYLSVGLQVIVGEFVGEAVRYSKEYFADRSIIYRNKKDIHFLHNKKTFENSKVDEMFGYHNLKKVIL